MLTFAIVCLGIIHTLQCSDIKNIYDSDESERHERNNDKNYDESIEKYLDKSSMETIDTFQEDTTNLPTIKWSSVVTESSVNRRYWYSSNEPENNERTKKVNNDKDAGIKRKIAALVEQTLQDTERKLLSLNRIKDKHKDEAPYKVGFILSLIKKSKVVLYELFNVAVKHRDDFKALEELKIFELIVHTNYDTTNLLRQMVEIHINYMTGTNPIQRRNGVVLL